MRVAVFLSFAAVILSAATCMGAIALEASATASGNSAAPSITHGLTIEANDVLTFTVAANGSSNSCADNNGSYPTTELWDQNIGVGSQSTAGYYRVAGASEPSSYAWTLGSSNRWSITLRVWSGVDTSTVFDVTPSGTTDNEGSTASVAWTAITIGTANSVAEIFNCGDWTDGPNWSSPPSDGYGDETYVGSQFQYTHYKAWASTGSTTQIDATYTYEEAWFTQHFSLKPAAVATGILANDMRGGMQDLVGGMDGGTPK